MQKPLLLLLLLLQPQIDEGKAAADIFQTVNPCRSGAEMAILSCTHSRP